MNIHKHARMTVHGRALLVDRVRRGAGASPTRRWRRASPPAPPASGWPCTGRAAAGRRLAVVARRRCPHHAGRNRRRDRATQAPARERADDRPRTPPCPLPPSARCCAGSAWGASPPSSPGPAANRYERDPAGRTHPHRHQRSSVEPRPSHHWPPQRYEPQPRHRLGGTCMSPSTDASRLAYTELLPDEKKHSACAFLNPGARLLRRPRRHRRAGDDRQRFRLSQPRLQQPPRHGRPQAHSQPYTPRTNGKAERFIQTSLREWPTIAPIDPPPNARPPCALGSHSALAGKPPDSRLNNVPGLDT